MLCDLAIQPSKTHESIGRNVDRRGALHRDTVLYKQHLNMYIVLYAQ
jgi:hypothetical protein